jgi:hypothetical protein
MAILNRYPERSYVQAPPLRFDKLGHSKEKARVAFTPTAVPKNIREILEKVIARYFENRFERSPK